MKAEDIIALLAVNLPKHTDKFTDSIVITSLTRSGSTVTADTAAPHNLVIGSAVNITGSKSPINIINLTRTGTVGELETDVNHDLTDNYQSTIEILGATEAEFNGTFQYITQPNRRRIRFKMADSGPTVATGSPLLIDGSSSLQQYNGLFSVSAIPSTTQFQYVLPGPMLPPLTTALGTPIANTQPRISGAETEERVIDSYTQQLNIDTMWAYVVLGDVSASKSRSIDSDATDNLQRGNEFRQQIIQPFSIIVIIPSSGTIAGLQARDKAEELFRPICQSILFSKIDSGLFVGAQNPVQFITHGFLASTTAYYVHTYQFEATADLVFEDTVGRDEDVAFRDITLNQFIKHGTQEDPLTSNIDLDEEPI